MKKGIYDVRHSRSPYFMALFIFLKLQKMAREPRPLCYRAQRKAWPIHLSTEYCIYFLICFRLGCIYQFGNPNS